MQEIFIHDEFIKLGQAMKLAGMVDTGAMAKEDIVSGNVMVNGEVMTMRGKKLYEGDVIEFNGEKAVIVVAS